MRKFYHALSDCFNETLTDTLDKFAPLKTRTMINCPKVPCFNDDIKRLKRQRRRLEKRAMKNDLPGDGNNYHKVRNQYSAFLKSARVNFYSNLIDQCAGDSRKLFRLVNSLCREPLETTRPKHTDPTKLANEFGTFFRKKIEIISENLDKFKNLDSFLLLLGRIWRVFPRYPSKKCLRLFENPPMPLVSWILFLHGY